MSLNVVSKSRVEGDNGLSIQLDRGKVKYEISGKHLNIEVEHGVGEVSIFSGSIRKWYPPFSDVPIGDIEKREILDNVCEALKLLGVGFLVE